MASKWPKQIIVAEWEVRDWVGGPMPLGFRRYTLVPKPAKAPAKARKRGRK